MLFVIQKGFNMVSSTPADQIVYCVISIQKVLDLGNEFVFTDGHAVDKFSTQYYAQNIAGITSLLDWNAIRSKYWKDDNDLDKKRKKEAEFLVLGDINISAIIGYIVYNENCKQILLNLGIEENRIKVSSDYYF